MMKVPCLLRYLSVDLYCAEFVFYMEVRSLVQLSQSTHRQSFITILAADIRQKAIDENLSFQIAATRVLVEWLKMSTNYQCYY